MTKRCVYCGGRSGAKISSEHAISSAVLKVGLGDPVANITRSTLIKSALIDHEQTVNNACRQCNSSLSVYDTAGMELARAIDSFYDASGRQLSFDKFSIGWLVKTHLNFLSIIRDKATNDLVPIAAAIRLALLTRALIPKDLSALFIEGIQGTPYLWDANDERRIPYFSNKSVTFLGQKIIVSNFRIKAVDTFLMLPNDGSYDHFEERVTSVLREMSIDFGINPQRTNVLSLVNPNFSFSHVVSFTEFEKTIRPYAATPIP